MSKLRITQAEANKIAQSKGLRTIVSGDNIYVVCVLTTVNIGNKSKGRLPTIMPELLQPYDSNMAFQVGCSIKDLINWE